MQFLKKKKKRKENMLWGGKSSNEPEDNLENFGNFEKLCRNLQKFSNNVVEVKKNFKGKFNFSKNLGYTVFQKFWKFWN